MTARILIIEDEEPLTTLLRYNLEAEGYAVESTARGDDADLRLRESTPDLAVIDWMVPGLSGIELVRRLRARPETQDLPIIMLTARGEETERVRGLATGADDYIVKPFWCRNSWRGSARCCGGPSPSGSPACSQRAISSLTGRRSASPAAGATWRSGDRIPPARIPDGKSRPGVLARAVARPRLGPRRLYRRAHRRCPCRASAQGIEPGPRRRPDSHRAGCGLLAQRPLHQGLMSRLLR